ncbi:MAG: flippase [Chloroflexota bacterium]
MSKPNTTLAKNISVLMGSQVITWLLTMVLMIFLPRYLGAANIGKLHLAISLWVIMSVVMGFGMDMLIAKEVAREPEEVSTLFGTRIVVGSLLFVLCTALLLLFLYIFNYPIVTIYVVAIIGIEYWIWQFVGATEAVLQGREKMEYISFGRIIGHCANVAISITLLLLGWGIFVIACVRIFAAAVVFGVQFANLRQLFSLRLQVNYSLALHLLRSGWPYFLASISLVVYMQLDVVIMSFLVTEEAIGWYGVADQLFGTLLFIPTAFITSIYPVFSRLFVNEDEPLKALMSKSFDAMYLLSVPIGLGLFLIAKPLVTLLYGTEFIPSGPVLAVFGIVLILTYLNMLIGQFLISIDRQRAWAMVMAAATLATIPLDLWLIPWTEANWANGAIGGAIAFVITEMGMLLSGVFLLPKGTLGLANVWTALRTTICGLVMLGIAWLFRDHLIAIPILVGAFVYGGMILLLGVIPKDDIASLWGFVQNVQRRFVQREVITVNQ